MFSGIFGRAGDAISPADVKAMIESGADAALLDVRSPEEYREKHIPGSVNLPLDRIYSVEGIVPDKNAKIIVYCLSGARASSAARALIRMGYTDVSNMGGIAGWPYKTVSGNNE